MRAPLPAPRGRPGPTAGLALILLLATGCGRREQAPPGDPGTEAAFTAAAQAAVAARHPDAAFDVLGPLQLRVRVGRFEGTLLLDNAWRHHRTGGLSVDQALASVLGALEAQVSGQAPEPLDPGRVLPLVRDEDYLREIEAHAAQARADPAERPFQAPLTGELVVLYGEDAEGHLSVLLPGRLAGSGLAPEGLAARARDNLARRLPQARVVDVQGLYSVELDGTYESSLLLVDAFWTAERFPVRGEIVAAVPARHVLLVTGTGHPERVAALRELARRGVAEWDHALSATLLVRHGTRWEVLPD